MQGNLGAEREAAARPGEGRAHSGAGEEPEGLENQSEG